MGKMSTGKKWLCALMAGALALLLILSGCTDTDLELLDDLVAALDETQSWDVPLEIAPTNRGEPLREDGHYSSKSEVGLYLYLYGHLPGNYLTKNEAYDLGWDSKSGNLWDVAPGMSIGGDKFGNREGVLPQGPQYYECDIDYNGGYRNSKRIVYTKDGYVYYTEDHYETFEQLYP